MVEHIFSSMDIKGIWEPFLLEIMVLVGYAYGTKNEMFQRLFTQEKAYLMGKPLTVESRLRCFSDSRISSAVTLFYTEKAYQRMLVSLTEILIEHNEVEFFKQFINHQCRVYMFGELISKGLEATCRNCRPRMALILASISVEEGLDYQCVDFSNLMPN